MDSNKGFYNILQICSQGAGLQQFYKYARKVRIHNLFAKLGFYNNFYNIHTDALFPVLILFIYNIHTGELSSGLTFISFATILVLFTLILSASNGSYLYFLLLVAGKFFLFSFILFWGGKGDWGYLYFLSPLRGF